MEAESASSIFGAPAVYWDVVTQSFKARPAHWDERDESDYPDDKADLQPFTRTTKA